MTVRNTGSEKAVFSRFKRTGIAAAILMVGPAANAFEIQSDSDLKVRWDNTVKYSAVRRTGDVAPELTGKANPNGDDGNLNFSHGLVSNRVDLLSEFDLTYHNVGARVSGAAWYDGLYQRDNRNNSPQTANTQPNNVFDPATAKLHGKKAEFLDAFVFAQGELGDGKLTNVRLGRHTLLYGESLFFGNNGIAGTQGPVDVIKALQVPSSQIKEILLPVNQLSGQVQLSPSLTVGGYFQLEWRKSRIPAAGSYLSTSDFLDDGGQRILAGAPLVPGGGPSQLLRSADHPAKDSGQFGLKTRWKPQSVDAEFGFYYTRSNSNNPIVYIQPSVIPGMGVVNRSQFNPVTGQVGTYSLGYAEGISTYGASVSTVVGDWNVAAEASMRRNTPLVNPAVLVLPGKTISNGDNPLYPVGNSGHVQVSGIYSLPRSALWDGGVLMGELAWNRLLSATSNAGLIDPNATRDASAIRVAIEPSYFQVISGLDLSIPMSFGYGLSGRSSVVPMFSVYHGGNLSLGVNATYDSVWKMNLTYVRFTGSAMPTAAAAKTPVGLALTFGQTLADRNFVALSVQRTF